MRWIVSHSVLRSGVISALLIATPALADGVTITDKDAGKTVSVPAGETLTVRLPGVRGEGYWRLDSDLTPELSLSGRTTESVLAPKAPETTIFSFATRTPGTVTLKASYMKNGEPANSFSVLVTVAES